VHNTTVARISPSGYYCASADISGTGMSFELLYLFLVMSTFAVAVRIWDTASGDQIMKGEYRVLSGRINDLEWDGESKRIIAVGDGKDK
jgi:hypothetical protein